MSVSAATTAVPVAYILGSDSRHFQVGVEHEVAQELSLIVLISTYGMA